MLDNENIFRLLKRISFLKFYNPIFRFLKHAILIWQEEKFNSVNIKFYFSVVFGEKRFTKVVYDIGFFDALSILIVFIILDSAIAFLQFSKLLVILLFSTEIYSKLSFDAIAFPNKYRSNEPRLHLSIIIFFKVLFPPIPSQYSSSQL